MRILISAYACEPEKGSEPGVGWNVAWHLAQTHDVCVLTRSNNRAAIERGLGGTAVPFSIIYVDLPRWLRWWKRGPRGVQVYYYLWQIIAFLQVANLNRRSQFDIIHHITFAKYWTPSFLCLLPAKFVWGPVGGGESTVGPLRHGLGIHGRVYELIRDAARFAGEHDPFVRLTARRSSVALATTEESAQRLKLIGADNVRVVSQVALTDREFIFLGTSVRHANHSSIVFISIGRLIHWKGYHIAVQAFARLRCPKAVYCVIGDGPERAALTALAKKLRVEDRIFFLGNLPRLETLRLLKEADVLVHPSFHDSGSWVCLEAMAAGRPVICLDSGGPSVLVTPECGVKIAASTLDQTVQEFAVAMSELAVSSMKRAKMGEAGRRRALSAFRWDEKCVFFSSLYRECLRI